MTENGWEHELLSMHLRTGAYHNYTGHMTFDWTHAKFSQVACSVDHD